MTKEEQIAADMFRIADKYIWMEDFVEFQMEVKTMLKEKHNIELLKIYHHDQDSPRRNQE